MGVAREEGWESRFACPSQVALDTLAKQGSDKRKASTPGFTDNVITTKNDVSTQDLRIVLHKDRNNENQAIATAQSKAQVTDQGVKDYIILGNKASGSRSGTHKIIATI